MSSNPRSVMALLSLSFANAMLAVWQWMELLVVAAGGKPTCSLSEKVDCAPVWQSEFAQRVRELTGLPVAGLGLQWSMVAFLLSLWVAHRYLTSKEAAGVEAALKLWGVLGLMACIVLGAASARIGIVCPSCLLTYALTAAFAGVAVVGLGRGEPFRVGAILASAPRALLLAVPLHLALLVPAGRTPSSGTPKLAGKEGLSDAEVLEYFKNLNPQEAEATSESLAEWMENEPPDYPPPPTRQQWGPPHAPMRLVEFTDVLCGHCRAFLAALEELKRVVPAGRMSIEPRYFPLDGECNPLAGSPRGDGIRCVGAKVQLCLEGRPEYWDVRHQIFENQQSLTVEKIYDLAAAVKGMTRADLEACVNSEATAEKLKTDIEWAKEYRIQGTPLVLINGKKTSGLGSFVFGMAMSGADPQSKFFKALPQSK